MAEPEMHDDPLAGIEIGTEHEPQHDLVHERIKAKFLQKIRRATSESSPSISSPSSEVKLGRYLVLGSAGAGRMGEVYVCYDARLNRKVAVKRVLGESSPERRARLEREGQALAKLSHPNVVQVHEIGEDKGRLFVAMEFVDGRTLREWLGAKSRSLDEILDTFVEAGRGLAAIHTAGLVHRDFKPDNVLVGENGAVRVADLGLAFESKRGPELDPTLSDDNGGPEDHRLTATGKTMGSVRYMPLEQLHGSTVDARADQFAFCVSLYEALWQSPPFPVSTRAERFQALEQGEPPFAPPDHPSLFRVLARGLAHRPQERWPSMDLLLDELDTARSRRSRWRSSWVFAASLGVVLTAGLAWSMWPEEPCADVEAQLGGVWDESTRAALEDHTKTLEASHAADSRSRIFANLDRWAGSWLSARRDACEALSMADPSESPASRAWNLCLTRQLAHADALVEELMDGDATALANAVIEAEQLGDPDACVGVLAQQGLNPPPAAINESVEDIRGRLEQARLHRRLDVDQAPETLEALEREARDLGYEPLLAEVLGERAMALDEGNPQAAAELYDSAIELAEKHGHAKLAAELLIERTELALHEMRELESARTFLAWVKGVAERAELGNETHARIAFASGRLLQYEGDLDGADLAFREALELADSKSFGRPTYLDAHADVRSQFNVAEALALRRESLELTQELFGPLHPFTAKRHYNYGSSLEQAGLDGEAHLELAAQIWIESADGRWLAKAKILLAREALGHGDVDTSEQLAKEAAVLLVDVLPDHHPEHGEPEQLLALVDGVRGDHEAALTHAHLALTAFEREVAGQGVDERALQMRLEVANHLLSLGRFDEARQHLSEVTSSTADPQWTGIARVRLAEIDVRQGRLDDADGQLRAVGGARSQLGPEQVSYELLRGLVDLRRGALEASQVDELGQTRDKHPEVWLDQWLVDLELDTDERTALGLPGA